MNSFPSGSQNKEVILWLPFVFQRFKRAIDLLTQLWRNYDAIMTQFRLMCKTNLRISGSDQTKVNVVRYLTPFFVHFKALVVHFKGQKRDFKHYFICQCLLGDMSCHGKTTRTNSIRNNQLSFPGIKFLTMPFLSLKTLF